MNEPIKFKRQSCCTVVNKYKSEYDVNIQRGTIWGNPCWDSTNPISDFKVYFLDKIKNKEITKAHLETLRYMRLGCTCKPNACHGDVIAEIVNKVFKDNQGIESICN